MDDSKKISKQHSFDSYCKKILKNEARDYQGYLSMKRKYELSIEDLSATETEQLSFMPQYFNRTILSELLDIEVQINNDDIVEALIKIPKDRREIILLYYFLDMTDEEIGIHLKLIQRTVNNRRNATLKILAYILKDLKNE